MVPNEPIHLSQITIILINIDQYSPKTLKDNDGYVLEHPSPMVQNKLD